MKILVRVDASTNIGMGHLMRTLTLAAEAAQRQWSVCFVMRDPDRILVQTIQKAGHQVRSLHSPPRLENKRLESELAHSSWLSVSQRLDAHQTLLVARDFYPYWLIVDHYSLVDCFKNIV